jgi:hypothetical protein
LAIHNPTSDYILTSLYNGMGGMEKAHDKVTETMDMFVLGLFSDTKTMSATVLNPMDDAIMWLLRP